MYIHVPLNEVQFVHHANLHTLEEKQMCMCYSIAHMVSEYYMYIVSEYYMYIHNLLMLGNKAYYMYIHSIAQQRKSE